MRDLPRLLSDNDLLKMREMELVKSELQERQQQEKENLTLTAEKICNAAKEVNSWIYDPENKQWYTPDEFYTEMGKFYKNHPVFIRVQIKNPIEGVEAGFKRMSLIQLKLIAFTRKVLEYYSGQK
ncbi:hypothetical protein EON78_07410 [bacterium]|nr:MAG: hypothetical protein EON78_07410 [bacterium]